MLFRSIPDIISVCIRSINANPQTVFESVSSATVVETISSVNRGVQIEPRDITTPLAWQLIIIFLQSLPVPILTPITSFLITSEDKLQPLQEAIKSLPTENMLILKAVFEMLHSLFLIDTTKYSANKLSRIIAPSLGWSKGAAISSTLFTVVEFMIVAYEQVFQVTSGPVQHNPTRRLHSEKRFSIKHSE